jgi:hypothetical protein
VWLLGVVDVLHAAGAEDPVRVLGDVTGGEHGVVVGEQCR